MRTKRILCLLTTTVLMILLAAVMCACGGNGSSGSGGGGSSGSGGNSGSGSGDGNVGWKNVNSDNVYNALILGCTNVAYEGSAQSVQDKNGVLTADMKVKISMGESDFWLSVLAKYKSTSPRQNTMVSIELSTTENATDESRIVSAHLYNDELYLAVGSDNKLKFAMENIAWLNYFPYEMKRLTSTDIGSLSVALTSAMVTNKANTAQFRHSEQGDEYRYSIDVDLDRTITSLFAFLAKSNKQIEMMDDIKKFVAVFFNVDEADIVKEDALPQSRIALDFNTINNTISEFKFDFDIDMNHSKLFKDGKMQGTVSLEKLKIGSNFSALTVPFVNDSAEQRKYEQFGNTIFTLNIPMTEYDDGQEVPDSTLLKVTTKVFQGAGEDDFIFAEYKDATTQTIQKGVYCYNNTAYFYSRNDTAYECICAFKIDDLGDLATRTLRNDLNGTSKFDPTKLLAYMVNSMSVGSQEIKVSLKPSFYKDVWYNFEDLCDYVNTFTEVDQLGIDDLADLYNFVKTNEVIVTFETHIAFLDILDSTNMDEVNDIVRMLGEVSEDLFLAPSGTQTEEEE